MTSSVAGSNAGHAPSNLPGRLLPRDPLTLAPRLREQLSTVMRPIPKIRGTVTPPQDSQSHEATTQGSTSTNRYVSANAGSG